MKTLLQKVQEPEYEDIKKYATIGTQLKTCVPLWVKDLLHVNGVAPLSIIERMPFYKTKTIEERFWSFVEKTNTCWIWSGGKDSSGYGEFHWKKIKINGHPRKKQLRKKAHRFSWFLHNGRWPRKLCVCHKCDTPACVRPDHLFLGTNMDNVRDCMRKGRRSKGEHRPTAKLTEKKVLEIRQRYTKGGCTHRSLAKEYGVKHATIGSIIRKKLWKHI